MIWKAQRRKKLFAQPLPPNWQPIVETRCPFYPRLPVADRRELAGHVQIFMAEKKFEGCDGLVITDEISLTIAAQACMLLLHRDTDYYPDLRTILVYPSSYFAPIARHIGWGVMEEGHQARAGESWREGAVVLAWAEVCKGTADPAQSNVVLHEFAHQLDFEDGYADGAPLLGNGESYRSRREGYAAWARIMKREYDQLCAQVQNGEGSVLRSYGATNPAEFFAVATESFFGKSQELLKAHPELYAQLKWYYHQDPAQW